MIQLKLAMILVKATIAVLLAVLIGETIGLIEEPWWWFL